MIVNDCEIGVKIVFWSFFFFDVCVYVCEREREERDGGWGMDGCLIKFLFVGKEIIFLYYMVYFFKGILLLVNLLLNIYVEVFVVRYGRVLSVVGCKERCKKFWLRVVCI